ncbi:MAG: hypothetical protein MGF17_05500 [Trichodesmium sp. MAG_R04]|nr:hypothetical protein [Trichodesmium sp. MAG_R04]
MLIAITVKSALATLSVTTVLTLVATTATDIISATLALIFPPLFAFGEAVSGSVAATYIVIVGLAYISTLEAVSVSYFNSSINKKEVEEFFKDKFSEELKKYSSIKISQKSDLEKYKKMFIDSPQ